MSTRLQHLPERDPHPPLIVGDSCLALLSQRLQTSPGVHGVEADFSAGTLTVRYQPDLVSPEAIEQLASDIAALFAQRVTTCDRRENPGACTECALRLGSIVETDGNFEVTAEPTRVGLARRSMPAGSVTLVRPLSGSKPWGAALSPAEEAAYARGRAMAVLTGTCLVTLLAGVVVDRTHVAPHAVADALWGVSAVTGGWFAARSSLGALMRLRFDVNLLMILAAVGAASIGYLFEAAVLMFLFSLSNTLEVYTMGRTRHALRALLKLRPARALVQRDGREVEVAAEDVRVGERVVVRPGEAIPVDGVVVAGGSLVDQSSLTGESVPVAKQVGDPVFAGTLAQEGAMEVRTSRAAGDTTLARIVALVAEAQEQKSRTEELAEWVGRYYTIVVIVGAGLMLLIPPLVLHHGMRESLYRAMTLLVVASPCALVIATPATILSAIANAARNGVLFKGGRYIEALGRVRVVAFDKTGTLTQGRFEVTDVAPVTGLAADALLAWAAAAERRSQHPLAQAIVRAAVARDLRLAPVEQLTTHLGRGITARVGGRVVEIGTPELFGARDIAVPPAALERARALSGEGKTAMLVRCDDDWGVIAAADTVRPIAAATVKALRGEGVRSVVLLSGDHPETVEAIARRTAVDAHRGALLPEDKVNAMAELEAAHGAVAMVGDGVNDAPALARATVGIAMGGIGSDAAMESADVVLMSDDLGALPYALHLARRARTIVIQNVTIASGVMLVLVAWVFAGQHTPLGALRLPVAVSGHEGSTVVVILNGLRLLGERRRAL